jgi:hypothetical protein
MDDLFQYRDRYPNAPGYRQTDTSRAAAQSMKPMRQVLLDKVLTVLTRFDGTADEISAILHEDKLSIRPRCTELQALGEIEDSGVRRRNESGRSAIVWRRVKRH